MPDTLSTTSELVQEAVRLTSEERGKSGKVLSAKVVGEINLHNSPAMRSDLLRLVEEEKPQAVILNLEGVPYMDSSAIAVLVEVLKALRADGGQVYLTNLQKRVAGLLHIARLDTIFKVQDDEATARSELNVA